MSDRIGSESATVEAVEARVSRVPAALRSLAHRDFALYWVGLLVSTTGSWMQAVAQGWLVYDLTHSKFYLGLVAAISSLPVFCFSLPLGVVADRFDKRKITIFTQTLAMAQAFALAALVYSHTIQFWHILALSAFGGLVNALDVPARQGMVPELVGKEEVLNAIAFTSSAFNGARIVGPAIAGLIVATSGEGACFLINGVSFVAVILSLLVIRPRRLGASRNDEPMLLQIREGLRYARGNAVIGNLLILTAIASLFGLQYGALLPALARDVFHAGPKGYGALMSAAGIGALSAALSVAALGHRFKPGTIVTAGSVMAPCGLILLSSTRSYPVAVACLVFTGFGMMMFLAVSNSLVQTCSPDALRGRMLSLRNLVFIGLSWLGALEIGAMAQRLGVRESILFGGIVCLAAAICFGLRSHACREVA